MNLTKMHYGACLIVCSVVSGCSDGIRCDDPATKAAVLDFAGSKLFAEYFYEKYSITTGLDEIKTTKSIGKNGLPECKAVFQIVYADKGDSEGLMSAAPITYQFEGPADNGNDRSVVVQSAGKIVIVGRHAILSL